MIIQSTWSDTSIRPGTGSVDGSSSSFIPSSVIRGEAVEDEVAITYDIRLPSRGAFASSVPVSLSTNI